MKKQALNPCLPSWEYNPDCEPRIFGDRLYLYGSHDCFGSMKFCSNDYVCWSAPLEDLGDWKLEGVIYDVKEDPLNAKGNQYGYAPDCVQGPDGRYYLYYCLHMDTAVSVAVCDTPAGTYRFYGHVRFPDGHLWGKKKGETSGFDPGVLVEEDGSVYLYSGFSPTKGFMRTVMGMRGYDLDGAWCARLEADMLTIQGQPKLVVPGTPGSAGTDFEAHPYFEASSPRKYNGRYYFVYSSQHQHELCYAMADSPFGPFTYGGVLHSNADIGIDGPDSKNYSGNNHGGLVRIGEKYYIFGHRHTAQNQYSRQVIAEEVTMEPDGKFRQAELTSCGLNGGPLAGTGTYPAYMACLLSSKTGTFHTTGRSKPDPAHPYFTQSGPDREENGDQYIANLKDGSWAAFRYFQLERLTAIRVSVRGDARGKLVIRTRRGGGIVGEILITAGADWHDCAGTVTVPDGKQALYVTYCGTGRLDWQSLTLVAGE